MEETKVVFNEDNKAILLKSLEDMHFANGQLYEWVRKDSLTKDMSKTLPSLIESYFSEAAKVLNYGSHLIEEKEKRHEALRNANIKIRELEAKLGSSKPVDGLKEQLQHLKDKVNEWWDDEGFNHVSDEVFTPYGGLRARYSFMLGHRRTFGKTPATDKRNNEQHIQHLRDKGFVFDDTSEDRYEKLHLIDLPKNRKLLREMLQERFPSLEIHSFKNRACRHNEDTYIIWNLDATIHDLNDI